MASMTTPGELSSPHQVFSSSRSEHQIGLTHMNAENYAAGDTASGNVQRADVSAGASGVAFGGRSSAHPAIARQSSIYSLTLNEFQNAFSDPEQRKNLGSMNMDEFLKNVWTAEESQAMAAVLASGADNQAVGLVRQRSMQRQNSINLPDTLIRKTVEQVWHEIQKELPQHLQNQDSLHQEPSQHQLPQSELQQLQPKQQEQAKSFDEMTLEDFLVRAGVPKDELMSLMNSMSEPSANQAHYSGARFQGSRNVSAFSAPQRSPEPVPQYQPTQTSHDTLRVLQDAASQQQVDWLIQESKRATAAGGTPISPQGQVQRQYQGQAQQQQYQPALQQQPQVQQYQQPMLVQQQHYGSAFQNPSQQQQAQQQLAQQGTAEAAAAAFMEAHRRVMGLTPTAPATTVMSAGGPMAGGGSSAAGVAGAAHSPLQSPRMAPLSPVHPLGHRIALPSTIPQATSSFHSFPTSPEKSSALLLAGRGASQHPVPHQQQIQQSQHHQAATAAAAALTWRQAPSPSGAPSPADVSALSALVSLAAASPAQEPESMGGAGAQGEESLSPGSDSGGMGAGTSGGGYRGRKRGAGEVVEVVVERRQKRMIKNRESAARSRARKQAYTVELETEVNQLKEENLRLRQRLEHETTHLRGMVRQAIEIVSQRAQAIQVGTERFKKEKVSSIYFSLAPQLRRSSSGTW